MAVKRDWVVLNSNTQRIECLRCGAFERLLGVQRIEVHLAHWKAFGAQHGRCKAQEKKEAAIGSQN